MRSIPTTYQGVAFRSRLEATWAVNLDALGIEWAYEPEGFQLDDGERYLPDFWLPRIRTWLEVKGPGVGGLDRTASFARSLADDALVVVGLAPRRGQMAFTTPVPGWWDYALLRCGHCGRASFLDDLGAWGCRACGTQGKVWRGPREDGIVLYPGDPMPWCQHQWRPAA